MESKVHRDVANTNATSSSHGGDWLKVKYSGRPYTNSQGQAYISEESSFSVAYKAFLVTTDPLRQATFSSLAEDFPLQTSPQSFTTPREEFKYAFKNMISTNEWILERNFSSKHFPDNTTQDFEDKPRGNFPNSGGTGSMIPLALINKPRLIHFFPVELFITETDPFAADSYLPGDFPTPGIYSPED